MTIESWNSLWLFRQWPHKNEGSGDMSCQCTRRCLGFSAHNPWGTSRELRNTYPYPLHTESIQALMKIEPSASAVLHQHLLRSVGLSGGGGVELGGWPRMGFRPNRAKRHNSIDSGRSVWTEG